MLNNTFYWWKSDEILTCVRTWYIHGHINPFWWRSDAVLMTSWGTGGRGRGLVSICGPASWFPSTGLLDCCRKVNKEIKFYCWKVQCYQKYLQRQLCKYFPWNIIFNMFQLFLSYKALLVMKCLFKMDIRVQFFCELMSAPIMIINNY